MDDPNQSPHVGHNGQLALASVATQLLTLLTEIIALLQRLQKSVPALALGVDKFLAKLSEYQRILLDFHLRLEQNLPPSSAKFHSVRLIEQEPAKTILQIDAGPMLKLSPLQADFLIFLAEAPSKGEYPGWVSLVEVHAFLSNRAGRLVSPKYQFNVVHGIRRKIQKADGNSVDVSLFPQVDHTRGIRLGVPKWAITRLPVQHPAPRLPSPGPALPFADRQ